VSNDDPNKVDELREQEAATRKKLLAWIRGIDQAKLVTIGAGVIAVLVVIAAIVWRFQS